MLDASVLLAYSRNETGVEQVRDALAAGATTSAVNWSETLTRLATVSALSAATLDQQLRTQGFAGDLLIIVPLVHDDAVLAAEHRHAILVCRLLTAAVLPRHYASIVQS